MQNTCDQDSADQYNLFGRCVASCDAWMFEGFDEEWTGQYALTMTNDLRWNCLCPADHYWYVGDVQEPACCTDSQCTQGEAAETLCQGYVPACCDDQANPCLLD